MKKMIISMLLLAAPVATFAQLKVFSDGKISVNRQTKNPGAMLAVENNEYTGYSNYNMSVIAGNSVQGEKFNIGVYASCFSNTALSSGRSFGLLGTGGNATSGYNYGVYGRLVGNNNGAAVAGTLASGVGIEIPGKYAGYFDGATKVNGTLYATNVVNTSDIRLKENITNLIDIEDGSTTLEKIQKMNVIEYNYKSKQHIPDAEKDTMRTSFVRAGDEISKERHYGLSAQELQAIYPNLVKEGQDGYLGVNYIELVPILIRSIQELKQELDNVKGGSTDMMMSRNAATAVTMAHAAGNKLYQNTPNPFKEQTTIRFLLADDAQNAAICIFDMAGKMLKKMPISSGESSVCINGWELGEGMFLYTLMVNGREIDTKRMILSK